MPRPDTSRPQICDYEGSNYRTEFWESSGRVYEDQVERLALRKLLPAAGGRRLLEIGAGFGRLTGEYARYDQVVLLDYSLSQLQYAQEQLGRSSRFIYVAADAYRLPFRPGVFDGATMIRVLHHMADPAAVLTQVRRCLAPDATFILEHANKRNLKSMLRYALKKQTWNPHTQEPVEFVELNFDFHPEHIRRLLRETGFDLRQRIPVSYLRVEWLKENLPTGLLVGIDAIMQHSHLLYAPSIFTKSIAQSGTANHLTAETIFASPNGGGELVIEDDVIRCKQSGQQWQIRDGIYDFKAPLD
jgi:ubiquinone/menaquinone biosynthesis C-methylase UbiE